jgi:hypothetical protein
MNPSFIVLLPLTVLCQFLFPPSNLLYFYPSIPNISTFHPLLSSSVSLISFPIFTGEVFTIQKSFDSSLTVLERCEFLNINNNAAPIGAVFSKSGLELFNCLFDSCSAAYGGGITSSSFLTLDFVTFSRCRAKEGGAIDLRTEEMHDVEFHYSLFQGNTAEFFGSLYRTSKGLFRIGHTNFTQEHALQCVGCGEAKFGNFECRFSVLSSCAADAHNGGICLRQMDQSVIENGLFENCTHGSSEVDAGAVFLMYDNPFDSNIRKCAFVGNRFGRSNTITCASGHSLVISECCFTASQRSELNSKNLVIENCLFEETECPVIYEAGARTVGFDRIRIVRFSLHLPRPTMSGTPALKKRQPNSEIFGISLIASIIIAATLTILQTAYHSFCKSRRKVPKAIL